MKRLVVGIWAAMMLAALCGCVSARALAAENGAAAGSGAEAGLESLSLPEAAEGWEESYIAFIDDNYDIFAALWPEGLTGVGFIDLDLDGTPEMAVFDPGASATMGVQLFDLADGQVYCVSSVLESAAGAFGDEHFSRVSVCASYFESFRLARTDDGGYCFWINSANGTLESSWDEIIRFDSDGGVLTPVSVCARYLESDTESGQVTAEKYETADGTTDAAGYESAAAVYTEAEDMGYDAQGVFLWNDMSLYDTTREGFLAMARDAAALYVPVA